MDQFLNTLQAAPPWAMLIMLVTGVALLLVGGNWFVEGSIRIARRMGWSTLLIGLTIVAFGTSSPELAFNIIAAINGNGDLSFGNVVGSNIANIALVLGLASLAGPLMVHSRVLMKELPLLILASALMVALAYLPWTSLGTGTLPRAGFTRTDGLVMLLCFVLVTWLWYRLAKADRADPLVAEVEEEAVEEPVSSCSTALLLLAVGLVALLVGGKLTEIAAVGLAGWLGLSQALIGLTVVAIATSLPELATSFIACRRGYSDLAVGNIVGSNMFNILLILGVTAVVSPVAVPEHRGDLDLAVMLALTLLLLPMAVMHRRRITRGMGVFLLLCYFAYLAFSVVDETTL